MMFSLSSVWIMASFFYVMVGTFSLVIWPQFEKIMVAAVLWVELSSMIKIVDYSWGSWISGLEFIVEVWVCQR